VDPEGAWQPVSQSIGVVIVAAFRRAILHLARLLHENYKLLATGKRLFFLRRLNCGLIFGAPPQGGGGGGTCQRLQKLCRQSVVAHACGCTEGKVLKLKLE